MPGGRGADCAWGRGALPGAPPSDPACALPPWEGPWVAGVTEDREWPMACMGLGRDADSHWSNKNQCTCKLELQCHWERLSNMRWEARKSDLG